MVQCRNSWFFYFPIRFYSCYFSIILIFRTTYLWQFEEIDRLYIDLKYPRNHTIFILHDNVYSLTIGHCDNFVYRLRHWFTTSYFFCLRTSWKERVENWQTLFSQPKCLSEVKRVSTTFTFRLSETSHLIEFLDDSKWPHIFRKYLTKNCFEKDLFWSKNITNLL